MRDDFLKKSHRERYAVRDDETAVHTFVVPKFGTVLGTVPNLGTFVLCLFFGGGGFAMLWGQTEIQKG